MVTAKELQRAVSDLQTTEPGPGLAKSLPLMAMVLGLSWWAFQQESTAAFVAIALATGTLYAALMVLTHDAIHHTLTGIRWYDEIVPRLISFPIIWVHGMYAEVHKLHHKMNGDDLADPERVQWTRDEYEAASRAGKFYARHQVPLDIFVSGGIGLIVATAMQALKRYHQSKGIRRQVWFDLAGIVLCNGAIYTYAATHGAGLRYLGFWLIMERIGGGVLQWRAHVEHYGLWGKGRHYFETQVYACRNLKSNALGSWFFNRLNYHSVHHAFPRVPFYKLGEAHRRFQGLYQQKTGVEPLIEEDTYFGTAFRLARTPTVIGAANPASPSGRRVMVPI